MLGALDTMFPTVPLEPATSTGERTITVTVIIHPLPDGHEATLSFGGSRRGERTLVDRDVECRGLADAIAVAVALIIDPIAANAALASRAELGSASPGKTNGAAPNTDSGVAAAPDPQPRRSSARSEVRFGVEAGALGSLGLLGNPAYGGYLGAVVTAWGGPTLRLRGARLVATPSSVADGRVLVDLWAAMIAACWRLPHGRRVVFHPCLDLGAGSQRGQGRGFTLENNTVHRPFLALGPSLTGSLSVLESVQVGLMAGLAANLWRQDYVIPPPPAEPVGGGNRVNDPGGVEAQDRVGLFFGVGVGTDWTFGGLADRR